MLDAGLLLGVAGSVAPRSVVAAALRVKPLGQGGDVSGALALAVVGLAACALPVCLSHHGGRPRYLTRHAASCSRHSMAAASLSRSTFRSWMIRLRSTLSRLQEPGNVFMPPR